MDTYETVVCVLSLLNGVVAVVGNTLFIVTFCRRRELLSPMHAYLVSISAASLVVGIIVLTGVSYFSRPYHLGFSSPQACLYQWVKSWIITAASVSIIYCLLAVAVERYRTCVGAPARGASLTSTVLLIALIWAGALTYTGATKYMTFQSLESFAVVIDNGDSLNGSAPEVGPVQLKLCHYCRSSADRVWRAHVVYFSLGYVVPLAAMTFLYASVIRRLLRNLRRDRNNSTERAKLRAIQGMVVNVCVFAVSWVPFFAVQMLAPLLTPRMTPGGGAELLPPRTRLVLDAFTLFGTANSWVHVLVYLRYSSQFSTAVREMAVEGAQTARRQSVRVVRRFHRRSRQSRSSSTRQTRLSVETSHSVTAAAGCQLSVISQPGHVIECAVQV
ncbi:Adenosine receptor A2b [Amphibalanus amphitrite]|uniref:Adenosine receptor A2b n=2 Tax=Amphibalanus amphitrite TaxID=1232801 RepID=A0A6A4VC39_AMPAM|nr:Adenosine receptor A2b [Amphibalanus amphitrite]